MCSISRVNNTVVNIFTNMVTFNCIFRNNIFVVNFHLPWSSSDYVFTLCFFKIHGNKQDVTKLSGFESFAFVLLYFQCIISNVFLNCQYFSQVSFERTLIFNVGVFLLIRIEILTSVQVIFQTYRTTVVVNFKIWLAFQF